MSYFIIPLACVALHVPIEFRFRVESAGTNLAHNRLNRAVLVRQLVRCEMAFAPKASAARFAEELSDVEVNELYVLRQFRLLRVGFAWNRKA